MYRIKRIMLILISLFVCTVTPQVGYAAPVSSADTDAVEGGIAFRIAYNASENIYEVYMTPSVTPAAPNVTLTAQVTIKVPHSETAKFTVDQLVSAVEGTEWALSSRINAPTESPNSDYLSFTVDFPSGNYRAFPWRADEELKVFSFANSSDCLGALFLMDNTDPFAILPNSVNTNPGNQIDVLGLEGNNVFSGITGGSANCADGNTRKTDFTIFVPITMK